VWERINILASTWKLKHYEVVELAVLHLVECNIPSREDMLGMLTLYYPDRYDLRILGVGEHDQYVDNQGNPQTVFLYIRNLYLDCVWSIRRHISNTALKLLTRRMPKYPGSQNISTSIVVCLRIISILLTPP